VLLRTRIALTFLLLLSAVLTAALYAVSAANRSNAAREVQRQLDVGVSVFTRLLESNRRLLTQAAQAVAADYGFREAVAANDTETMNSALENAGARVGAALVVLTSLDGHVLAASGSHVAAGSVFPITAPHGNRVLVDSGKIYQMVTVPVRSPLPVAWISMGFALDDKAARELADITGLGVTLSLSSGARTEVASTVAAGSAAARDTVARRIALSNQGDIGVEATLSRSLSEARAPFERLTDRLFLIAAVSLIAFGWTAFAIARNITRPLRDLTRSVDRIRGGDYELALTVHRRDELGVLADGLKHMQTAVQSRDQSIRRLAYQDALTGLMNRTAFGAALSVALSDLGSTTVAVAVINLLRFRRINEHLGYPVGDEVLKAIASRLSALPSVDSAVARLATDEFAAFTRLADPAQLQAWGTSLLAALVEPVIVEAQPIDIAATVGLALASGVQPDADDLLRRADVAVGRARREKHALAIYQLSARGARATVAPRGVTARRRGGRAASVFPAQDRIGDQSRRGCRSVDAMATSQPRLVEPRRFHTVRRTNRFHSADHALGARSRRRPGRRMASRRLLDTSRREHQRGRHRRAARFAHRRDTRPSSATALPAQPRVDGEQLH